MPETNEERRTRQSAIEQASRARLHGVEMPKEVRFQCQKATPQIIVLQNFGKLVRQSQIVQSVMQDYQYDLSHLLPVCNLLVQGPKITYIYCLSRRPGLLW